MVQGKSALGLQGGKSCQAGLLEEEAIQLSRSEWGGRGHQFLQESTGRGAERAGCQNLFCGPHGVERLSLVCGQAENKQREAPPWGQLGYKASTSRTIPDPWGALQKKSTSRLIISMAPCLWSLISSICKRAWYLASLRELVFFLIVEPSKHVR